MKKNKGLVQSETALWILAIIVLVVLVLIVFFLRGKGTNLLEAIFNAVRFGK